MNVRTFFAVCQAKYKESTMAEKVYRTEFTPVSFLCPVAAEFGDLPKASTGKIQKVVLRKKAWAGYEKRVH